MSPASTSHNVTQDGPNPAPQRTCTIFFVTDAQLGFFSFFELAWPLTGQESQRIVPFVIGHVSVK